MDFLTAPSSASSPSPRSSAVASSSGSGDMGGGSFASQLAEKLICAIVTCVFATVGSVVGAVTGALIGLATESGMFRGCGIGAISGAVFSIEVVESSLALWHSNDSGIWSILYVIDILASLLSGRLVREKVGPAVQSAVQSQMSAVDSPLLRFLIFLRLGEPAGCLQILSTSWERLRFRRRTTLMPQERKCAARFAFRIFKLGRRRGACLIAGTCSTCSASTAGSSGMALARCVGGTSKPPSPL